MMLRLPAILICTATISYITQECHGTSDGSDFVLRKKHDHLLSKLSYYELVRPHRSTQDGDFLSNDLSPVQEENRHHRTSRGERNARSTDHDQGRPSQDSSAARSLHFRVDAFGVSLLLKVSRSENLVSPGLTVDRYGEDESRDSQRLRLAPCFYAGSVTDIAGSSVAISTCNGLSGLIQAGSEEYIIEPLESVDDRLVVNASKGHLHVMYRSKDLKMESTDLETEVQIELHRDSPGQPSGEPPQDDRRESRHRDRRAPSDPTRQYFVETILTVDHSMVVFHGLDDLPLYLLTMLNIVNRIYRHHTLDVDIQFIATKIIVLSKATSKTLIDGQRYKQSMTNVFTWVSSLTPPGLMPGSLADYVSFVTHLDFGPAGFAPISAICDGFWSSSITRDQGLASAFVMAHEAGHVLGLNHDGDGNSCALDTYAKSIMNALVVANYGEYFWSTCSNAKLKQDIGGHRCLEDVPFKDGGRKELHGYPGEWHTLDQQCQYTFGGNSRQCGRAQDYYLCAIRCTDPSNQYVCYEYFLPALDGSACGSVTQWCMNGACMEKPPRRNGKWSKWSQWTPCTYDCGTGVRSRQRKCDNPRPAFGGKQCKGRSFQYKICNTQPCAVWSDRRAAQCHDRLASVTISGKFQRWRPHQHKNESLQCRLTCISKKTLDILSTPYVVTDGTPCTYDDRHSICVRGKCKKLGCNKQAGSAISDDLCGVCNGDNSGCILVEKVFAETPRKRYRRIETLPAGAYNIMVEERSNTSHFLALRNHSDKSYILNGGGAHRGWPSFVAAGARFDYTVDSDLLTSMGPLQEALDILVYWTSDKRPVNIAYSYYLQRASETSVGATELPGTQ